MSFSRSSDDSYHTQSSFTSRGSFLFDSPEKAALREIIDKQRVELQSRTEMLERARLALKTIQNENENMRVSEAITNLDSLQKELMMIKAEKEQFQSRAKQLENIVKELKKDKESLFEQIEKMKEQVMNNSLQEAKNRSLNNDEFRRAIQKLEEEKIDLKNQIDRVEQGRKLREEELRNEVKRTMLEKMAVLQKEYQEVMERKEESETTITQLTQKVKDIDEQLRQSEQQNTSMEEQCDRNMRLVTSLKDQVESRDRAISEMKSERKNMVEKAQLDKLYQSMSEICTILNVDSFDKAAPSVRRLVLVARGVNQWIQDSTSPVSTTKTSRRSPQKETSLIAEALSFK